MAEDNVMSAVMSLTKNRALASGTKDYLDMNPIQSVDDIRQIEAGVLASVHDKFDEHNVVCDKDKKWKNPDSLSFAQIALIMDNAFTIRNIRCCSQNNDPEYDLLGIYVDENVVSLLDQFEDQLGIYVTTDEIFRLLAQEFNFNITERECKELLQRLKDRASKKRVFRCEDPNLVAVANGIFDYKTKQLYDFSSDYVFLTKSQVAYNPNAQLPVITMPDGLTWDPESWVSSLSDDPEVVNLLWEIIGAVIRPNVRWNKSAWMISDTGNNGKGTLCEMMRLLCGDGSCTSIPLSDFSKDFALEPLIRSQAIIVDENDVGTFIDKAGNLKAIITNDVVTINRKFKPAISFQFKGFMVQCLNEKPRIKDKSDSFYRRQLFIPMTKCFTGIERPYIKNDYLHRKEVLEYILHRVLNMTYETLSEPVCCKIALDDYKGYNDPVRAFWDELHDRFTWNLLPFEFLYDLYKSWFKQNVPSGTVQSRSTFIDDLINAIKISDDWICKGRSVRQRVTKDNMAGPEYLIVEYGLDKWRSSRYKGSDISKMCEPDVLAEKYSGLIRVSSNGQSNDDGDEQTDADSAAE